MGSRREIAETSAVHHPCPLSAAATSGDAAGVVSAPVAMAASTHGPLSRCLPSTTLERASLSGAPLEEHYRTLLVRTEPFRQVPVHKWGSARGPFIENQWIASSCCREERGRHFGPFVPIFVQWVDIFHQVLQGDGSIALRLRATLEDVLRPDVLYVTVSQSDDGIGMDHSRWSALGSFAHDRWPNILVISAGGVGHVPIPLLGPLSMEEPPKVEHHPFGKERSLLFFSGTVSNHQARKVALRLLKTAGYEALASSTESVQAPPELLTTGCGSGTLRQMSQARFFLNMRGYGRMSFMLANAIQRGVVPVFLYDDIAWLPYAHLWSTDQLGFVARCCDATSIRLLVNALAAVNNTELSRRRASILSHRHLFTYNGTLAAIREFVASGGASGLLRCSPFRTVLNRYDSVQEALACGSSPTVVAEKCAPVRRSETHLAVPNVTTAVAGAVRTQSWCVPEGAVALSYFNRHAIGMRKLQFARVQQLQCFMARLVSVGFGAVDDFGVIVRAPELPKLQRQSVDYMMLTWLKWRLMLDVLRAASSVLYLDSDVLILRNPFDALPMDRWFDVRFQTEQSCDTVQSDAQCHLAPRFLARDETRPATFTGCSLNGGLIWLRSAAVARRVIGMEPNWTEVGRRVAQGELAMPLLSSRQTGLLRGGILDEQDAADRVVRSGGSFCPLPSLHFSSGCTISPKRLVRERAHACGVHTYHTTCYEKMSEKQNVMRAVLKHMPGSSASSLEESPVVRQSSRSTTKDQAPSGFQCPSDFSGRGLELRIG